MYSLQGAYPRRTKRKGKEKYKIIIAWDGPKATIGDRKKTGMGSNGEAKLGNMGEPKIRDIFATKYNKI